MDAQLRLLNPPPARTAPAKGPDSGSATPRPVAAHPTAWRLSADTRKIGRQGVAQARAVLHSARRPLDDTRQSAA